MNVTTEAKSPVRTSTRRAAARVAREAQQAADVQLADPHWKLPVPIPAGPTAAIVRKRNGFEVEGLAFVYDAPLRSRLEALAIAQRIAIAPEIYLTTMNRVSMCGIVDRRRNR